MAKIKCPSCGKSIPYGSEKCEYCGYQFKWAMKSADRTVCPKCGSPFFTPYKRGYSFFTGFMGSNQTYYRCDECGHQWKPKKKKS